MSTQSLAIEPIQPRHVPAAVALWQAQYRSIQARFPTLSRRWLDDPAPLTAFIADHAAGEAGLVALAEDELVGYMLGDTFPFHGQPTAFCPISGHAVRPALRAQVYPALYHHMAARWVEGGCLDHLLTVFAAEPELQTLFFELGFGLYVVDGYRPLTPLPPATHPDDDIRIGQADPAQTETVFRLGEESRDYYLEAPLFLVREAQIRAYYRDVLADETVAVFLAEVEGRAVGFLNVRRQAEPDLITLTDEQTGTIDPLGAYIQPAYRGLGLGRRLLAAAIDWCRAQNLARLHVDYEAANLLARRFWPKQFHPVLYSVKRSLNRDAADTTD